MKSFLFFEIKAINILWVMLTGTAKCSLTTFLKFFQQLYLSFTSLNPNGTVLHVPWMGGHFISLQHLVTTQVPIISKQSAISP